MTEDMDTIIALSSGHLPSGVAVVRVSGPQSRHLIEKVSPKLPDTRRATLCDIRSSEGEVIDEAIVLWFPGPNSFTGDDVAEFHLHGGKAVVSRFLELATDMDGVRLAEAAEFTRRAFANGKMDLTEAEGLADLIDAETEAQRKAARYLAAGDLKRLYEGWQDKLLEARALIEADIDFSDEDDVPGSVAEQVWLQMDKLRAEILAHLESYGRSEKIRDGFRISLVGKPNVGKSSLLNSLAGSDRAIVSEEAGTTRDVVEVRLDLGGYLVLLSDTAGLRERTGSIETEGIRRSIDTAAISDLVLHLSDDGEWPDLPVDKNVEIIHVFSKSDLNSPTREGLEHIDVSVFDTDSVDRFVTFLTNRVAGSFDVSVSNSVVKSRYLDHLKVCYREIEASLSEKAELEIRVEGLRRAAFSLGRITGQHDTEDVLGRIFSSFCIGK